LSLANGGHSDPDRTGFSCRAPPSGWCRLRRCAEDLGAEPHRVFSRPGAARSELRPTTGMDLVNIRRLMTAYYTQVPDPWVPAQRVVFGTSGHRGSSLNRAFNQAHVLAITEAICRYRHAQHIDEPLFLGLDTHALHVSAAATALEVVAAHGVCPTALCSRRPTTLSKTADSSTTRPPVGLPSRRPPPGLPPRPTRSSRAA
jgi:hypothetical protein